MNADKRTAARLERRFWHRRRVYIVRRMGRNFKHVHDAILAELLPVFDHLNDALARLAEGLDR